MRGGIAAGVAALLGLGGLVAYEEYDESQYRNQVDKTTVRILGALANDRDIANGGAIIDGRQLSVEDLKADNAPALATLDKFKWVTVRLATGQNTDDLYARHQRNVSPGVNGTELYDAELRILGALHQDPTSISPDLAGDLLWQIQGIKLDSPHNQTRELSLLDQINRSLPNEAGSVVHVPTGER